ncbi:hypothetical protein [Desulfosporosinus sp. Sb-LF]|nr:hypothetical protein [Desulfosporosinus sp. Sb-LF]
MGTSKTVSFLDTQYNIDEAVVQSLVSPVDKIGCTDAVLSI